ncbi:MAG: hypothetical protein ACYTGB_20360 [Planctomycetota bacterium]|jgi:6-phosphofructokinase 1
MAGDLDGSVAIRRAKTKAYRVSYFRTALRNVAGGTKHMPRGYINRAGNGVTAAFVKYASPLTGKLPVIGKLG